jgi:hypothetical protein
MQSGKWIMEAPKSWSQFRGPWAVVLWGKKASYKAPRRQRCRKPIAVAEGLTGDSPSFRDAESKGRWVTA